MVELSLGPWNVGIDNISRDGDRPDGTVKDAVNIDFNRAGGLQLRPGRVLKSAVQGVSSLWKSRATDVSYCVVGPAICRANMTDGAFSTTVLFTRDHTGPVTFADLGDGRVVWADTVQAGTTDGLLLGVENPGGLICATETYGGLSSGRYGLAVTFLRGIEESALSPGAFVQVGANGGIRLTIPQPIESETDGIRIYRTEPNGGTYYRVADVGLSASYLLGKTDIGRAANTQFMTRIIGGQLVRYWRGHALIARGSDLLYSQSLRYGLYDPRHDFVSFPSRIRIMEPVEGGVFVGTGDGMYFLPGAKPQDWSIKMTGGRPPIEGTGCLVDAAELGGLDQNLDKRAEIFALWLARTGFVLGSASGQIIEVQASRIKLPLAQLGSVGSIVVSGRRAIAVIN